MKKNKKKLDESFAAMKIAFAAAIKNEIDDSQAEMAITEVEDAESNTSGGLPYDMHIHTIYGNKYWLIYTDSTILDTAFVFAWNTETNQGKCIALDYEFGELSAKFIKETNTLLIQFVDKSQIIEFAPNMEIVYNQTFFIPEEMFLGETQAIDAIDIGNKQHVFLYGNGIYSIGILDIKMRKLFPTEDLVYGSSTVWSYGYQRTILVIKTIDHNTANKQSFLIFKIDRDKFIKLMSFKWHANIKNVNLGYLKERKMIIIGFENAFVLTFPFVPYRRLEK
jgi:hypothetical protein